MNLYFLAGTSVAESAGSPGRAASTALMPDPNWLVLVAVAHIEGDGASTETLTDVFSMCRSTSSVLVTGCSGMLAPSMAMVAERFRHGVAQRRADIRIARNPKKTLLTWKTAKTVDRGTLFAESVSPDHPRIESNIQTTTDTCSIARFC